MSAVLQNFTFPKKGRPDFHPYDRWFDGKIRQITKGVDFDVDIEKMSQRLKSAATNRGYKLSVAIRDENRLAFQATPKVI